MTNDHSEDAACSYAHQQLCAALALLDVNFRDPDLRPLRARLIDSATVACANARLQRHQDMRANLQTLLADALAIPADRADETTVRRLQRLIKMALSNQAEPDV